MAKEPVLEHRRYRRYFIDIGRFYRQKKTRVYTGIVLSLSASCFFLIFAIRPTLITIAGLWKEIDDKEEILEKLENKVQALDSAQLEYQRLKNDFYLVEQALPKNTELSLFVREIETLARVNNTAIRSLQFRAIPVKGQSLTATTKEKTQSPETTKSNSQEVGFSLSLDGSYHQLSSFLDSLNQLRRLVLVESFTFQKGKEEENLTLNIQAVANYLVQKQ